MKNSKLTFAILAMVVATVVSVAIVSCKKETSNVLQSPQPTRTFVAPNIDDMNTYLKDFKQKMQSSTKGDSETLSLDEAAWHLACLANVDFCRVNVDYNNMQFDTIDMQVNAIDGFVTMYDLNTAYEQMRATIQQFQKEFSYCDQNLYFINMFIDESGHARIALATSVVNHSKDIGDHIWYFEDSYILDTVCYYFFVNDTQYVWDGYGKTELQRILNLYEHHTNNTPLINYYTPTRNHTFSYPNYPDPYGSQFASNSRLFAGNAAIDASFNITPNAMCYCLDSYLGLGYDYIIDGIYENEHPVSWLINTYITHFSNEKFYTHHHSLTVQYGQLHVGTIDPNPSD